LDAARRPGDAVTGRARLAAVSHLSSHRLTWALAWAPTWVPAWLAVPAPGATQAAFTHRWPVAQAVAVAWQVLPVQRPVAAK